MKKLLSFSLLVLGSYVARGQCTPIVAPFTETFPSNSLPTCWTQGGDNVWEYDNASFSGPAAYGAANAGEHTGTPGSWSIMMDGSDNGNGEVSWLRTPVIDVSGMTYPALSYWVFSDNTSQPCNNTFDVEVSTDGGTTWNLEETWSQNFGSQYVLRVVSLSAYTGSTSVEVRFTVTGMPNTCGSAFYNDILLDDIGVIDCTPTFNTISATSCGYYTAPSGKLLHDAGTYMDTIPNSVGCDSVITINLTTTNTFSTINPTACTYTSPSGKVWGVSGTYSDTIPNNAGCDSVITINLTSNNTTNSFSTTACNTYTSPSGVVYTASGVYMDTITNSVGCDSIMTISLTVNYNDNLTIFITTCGDPYTSDAGNTYTSTGVYIENNQTVNGCDSTVYIDVLISEGNTTTIPVDACEEFTSDAGITYTTSGSHVEEYVGVTGCDSIRTYDVTIHTVDATVSLIGNDMLEANEAGATYQWVDCNNGNAPIAGETNQTFTATVNGDYACIITTPYCSEMSDCIRIDDAIGLGIGDETNVFSMYPNPSTGLFTVELNDLTDNTLIVVSDAAGQIVYSEIVSSNLTNINLEDVEAGMYFISVSNAASKAVQSIVIE